MPFLFAVHSPLNVSIWSLAPFLLLLQGIAFLPLLAEHFWHSNRNKFLIVVLFALPTLGYLAYLEHYEHQHAHDVLVHYLKDYVDFIVLLAALYTVSGGIYLQGTIKPSPLVNSLFLAIGAVLANFIGTTGASMVLIRPFLRINHARQKKIHLPVFFIFIVSNLGGMLTPLGDPPLFLGFKEGIDFAWTLRELWQHWLVAVGIVLAIFFVWDWLAFRREPHVEPSIAPRDSLRLRGLVNVIFLVGIIAGVLFQSPKIARHFDFQQTFGIPYLEFPWGSAVLAAMALLSLLMTPRDIRAKNEFTWGAMIEVAVLFLGIFVTMVPALEYLKTHSNSFPLHEPWAYFWLTGILSSFLDNAPTYLTFASAAAGENPLSWLMTAKPDVLRAISAGAVFMGANTYIGNGPNFMVKAIADSMRVRTPSFFGYMLYSGCILLPTFAVITWLFF